MGCVGAPGEVVCAGGEAEEDDGAGVPLAVVPAEAVDAGALLAVALGEGDDGDGAGDGGPKQAARVSTAARAAAPRTGRMGFMASSSWVRLVSVGR
ncbi:hypothetical protein GCM10027090_01110 [Sinomonas soli]